MASSGSQRLLRSTFFPICLILTPDVLFNLTVGLLFLIYGGHRRAILGNNPYCSKVEISSTHNPNRAPRVILQLSDIHVADASIDKGKSKLHLNIFRDRVLPKWTSVSHAIVITGDLVNAIERPPYPLGTRSKQLIDEWKWLNDYAQTINQSIPWFPTHGNHDTFGGHPSLHPGIEPMLNELTTLRMSTKDSRIVPHFVANHSILLIAVDATQTHPIHRPLNFFGDAKSISQPLRSLLLKEQQDYVDSSRGAIAFGHYPSSTLASGHLIHSIASPINSTCTSSNLSKPRFAAYISGHLHSLYGIAPDGLSAVSSVSGALELQTLDLVSSGAYRVLSFDDSGILSTATTLRVNASENPLDEVVVLSPPKSGLCAAGAGTAALTTPHVRFLSPFLDLSGANAHVKIDGTYLGDVISLSSLCYDATPENDDARACKHVYGVEWDPLEYSTGLHILTLSTNQQHSLSMSFSLDGTVESSIPKFIRRLVNASFALSDFESIAFYLSISALFLSALLILKILHRHLYTLKKKSLPIIPIIILVYILAVFCGLPLLISPSLTVHELDQDKWGSVSLYSLRLPSSGTLPASVDAPFIFARHIFWPGLFPIALAQTLHHADALKNYGLFKYFLLFLPLAATRRMYRMSLEIAGAHGVMASFVSPGPFFLFILSVFTFISMAFSISSSSSMYSTSASNITKTTSYTTESEGNKAIRE